MFLTQWFKAASVVLALGAAASGVGQLAPKGDADGPQVVEVKPGRLSVSVAERGVVEAAANADVFNNIEGQTAIMSILPEGTKVTKGQLVATLDTASLKDQLSDQNIATKGAEAAYLNAKINRQVAEIALVESDELTRQAAWELAKSKEEKIGRQIGRAKLHAPTDGLLDYANDPDRRTSLPQIAEGAPVFERQMVFRVFDPRNGIVRVKVPESKVHWIARGQRAEIRVDALPGAVLTGTVEAVAPRPDPFTASNPGKKLNSARVAIDRGPEGLRPGMPARAEILVADHDDVLSVPVQAVLRYDDKDHVAVQSADGGTDRREVTLGATDENAVEVRAGLRSGDRVAVNPLALMSEEEKRQSLGKSTAPVEPKPTP